jgi:hypothetical protein
MRKAFLFVVLAISLVTYQSIKAQITPALQPGVPVNLFGAATVTTGNSTAYALLPLASQCTWQSSFGSAPASITLQLQTSNNNSVYSTIDTSTSTAGEVRTINTSATQVRARINASSGGTAITVSIVCKTGVIPTGTVIGGSGLATELAYWASTTTQTGSTNMITNGHGITVNQTFTSTGSTIITNGNFAGSASGWTLGDNATYGTNDVVVLYSGGTPTLSQPITTVAGQWYSITVTSSGGNAPFYFGFDNEPQTPTFLAGSTEAEFYFQAVGGADTFYIDDWPYVNGDTWTITSVSIVPITTPTGLIVKVDDYPYFSAGSDDIRLESTAFGLSALASNTTGYQNTAFGRHAAFANTTGQANVAIGYDSLWTNTTGSINVAVGGQAMFSNTTGSNNTSVGQRALYLNTTGGFNTGIGEYALENTTTGSHNTALGMDACDTLSTGQNTTCIGDHADVPAGNSSNMIILGNGSVTDVYFGSSTPSATIRPAYVLPATGYKSVDGSTGATVTTCTGFKNGLCISGT